MLLDSVLDSGGRGVGQALAGIGCAVLLVLLVALVLPVLVVFVTVLQPGGGSAPVQAVTGVGGNAVAAPGPQSVQPTTPTVRSQPPVPDSAPRNDVVEMAQRYLGVPYLFGGTNPAVGLDCSGLVQLVFRQLGISLPRTAQQQYDATPHLAQDQLQPGDLVFFARTYADPTDWVTHVGIYIGNGQQINAPTDGQRVSVQPVFTGFWGAHFAGGGRVLAR